MQRGRDPGAAACVHGDRRFREVGLQQQGVRYYADIRAQADELNGEILPVRDFVHQVRKGRGAEGVFLHLDMGQVLRETLRKAKSRGTTPVQCSSHCILCFAVTGEPDPSYKEDEKGKENEKEEDGEMDF